jgi:hypothetical protein
MPAAYLVLRHAAVAVVVDMGSCGGGEIRAWSQEKDLSAASAPAEAACRPWKCCLRDMWKLANQMTELASREPRDAKTVDNPAAADANRRNPQPPVAAGLLAANHPE